MNRHGKTSVILLATLLGLLTISVKGEHAAAPAHTIRVSGTGGTMGAMKEMAEAFKKKNPDAEVIIVTPPFGSTGGIKAVIAGVIDIGLSARPLKESERNQGVNAVEYGRSPFVFVVRPENRVSDITLKEVSDIYSGKMTHWPDKGLIRLVLRPASDSHTLLLKGISPEMNNAMEKALAREGINIAATDSDNAELLEKLPGAFGTAILTQIITEKRGLKPLFVNGIKPGPETVANGKYPLVNSSYYVTGQKSSQLTKKFIDFISSAEGKKILRRTGHLVK